MRGRGEEAGRVKNGGCILTGMTKVKFSKSEENNTAFLERRRAALERCYMCAVRSFGNTLKCVQVPE